jgi:hypothetical protein
LNYNNHRLNKGLQPLVHYRYERPEKSLSKEFVDTALTRFPLGFKHPLPMGKDAIVTMAGEDTFERSLLRVRRLCGYVFAVHCALL